jgi:hypothetical chaperone protein
MGIGLDFGTTNCALAIAEAAGPVRVASFPGPAGALPSFRSVLFFGREDPEGPTLCTAGPKAVDRYLEMDEERRLMQSLKSFLASRLFSRSNVFGRIIDLEELIARILRQLREESEADLGRLEGKVVVGRPVRYAKSKGSEDDDHAIARMGEALGRAGFRDVVFEYEPIAAAHHYEQDLSQDELVMIADFGGGTSDFCLLRVGPSFRGRARRDDDILATRGVALAGDAFDARIVRNVVAPVLGRGSQHRNMFGELLPVPVWIYKDLERWHHLSFLKSPRTLSLLHEIRDGAEDEAALTSLIHIVEYDLGFHLYRAVERTKRELSQAAESRFVFDDGPAKIDQRVTRADFEAWIAPEIEEIAGCVDALLTDTGTAVESVDRVFMTGGSSFVPAVRGIFADRFGEERLRAGGELISVASGLALRARSLE